MYRYLPLVIFCLTAWRVWADAYDLPPVVAVQDRAYLVQKEVTPYIGILPLDAFNKTVLFGGSFTYGWRPQWSWEVINAAFAANLSTNLKAQLENNFHVQPNGILDFPTSMYMTELLYSPMYGKYLLFNKTLVPNELSLTLSGGAIDYSLNGMVPVFGPGLTQRFYISQDSSIKFDMRILYQYTDKQSSNLVFYLTIGYSIHLDSKTGSGS